VGRVPERHRARVDRQPQASISPIALNTSILMPAIEVSEPELDALVAFLLAAR